jgi:DNA-binding response OmpR family regulator
MATARDKPIVLVVEDEPAIRLLCRVNLELEGYEVAEAGSLAAARTALGTHDVAVVLLDMHLGLEHGVTLLQELLTREPRIPVAVVSGSTELHDDDYVGADAVIPKPFTIDQLTGVVRSLAAR